MGNEATAGVMVEICERYGVCYLRLILLIRGHPGLLNKPATSVDLSLMVHHSLFRGRSVVHPHERFVDRDGRGRITAIAVFLNIAVLFVLGDSVHYYT